MKKPATPTCGNNLVAVFLEDGSDGALEVVRGLVPAVIGLLQNAGTGKDQILLQRADAPRAIGSSLDALGIERAEHDGPLLRAREQYVKATMAVRPVDGTKTLVLISAHIGAIGRRYEDNVPFVALDILKILDEQGFLPARHPLLVGDGGRIVPEAPVEQFLDKLPLLKIECHDAERFIGVLAHVLQDGLDDHGRFARIPAVFKDAVGDEMMLYPERGIVVIGGRENDEIPLVKLVIGKCDEAVMA